jgi:hypothetical protein
MNIIHAVPLLLIAVQFVLLARLWIITAQERRSFRRMRGRPNSLEEATPRAGSWLSWVRQVFHFSPISTAGREDASRQLDVWLADQHDFHALNRTAVLPPVVGVFITAYGFFTLQLPQKGDLTLDEIFHTIQPLFEGVLIGAILTFLTQFLLFRAARFQVGLRREALGWFDEVVWPLVAARGGAGAADRLVASAQVIHDAAVEFNGSQRRLDKCLASFGETLLAFRELVMEGFAPATRELQDLHATLAAMRATAKSLGELLELQPRIAGLCEGLTQAADTAREVSRLPQRIQAALDSLAKHLIEVAEHFHAESESLLRQEVRWLPEMLGQAVQEIVFQLPDSRRNGHSQLSDGASS